MVSALHFIFNGVTSPTEKSTNGSDDSKADPDEDGIKNIDEIYTHKTNPIEADTDGDGISDNGDPDTLYKFDLKAFGQDEYVNEVNKKALLMYDTIIDLNSMSKGAGVDVFDVPKDKLYHSIVDLFPNGNYIQ